MSRATGRAFLAAALLSLSAPVSAAPASAAPYLDLVESLPLAEVRRESGRLDLRRAEDRRPLRRGFSLPEQEGEAFHVWSDGEESELEFFLAEKRDLELSWRCLPYSYPGAPPQAVTVVANGRTVGTTRLTPNTATYRVTLPAGVLQDGDNSLVFRYAWARSPREVNGPSSPDSRKLAVAWKEIAFATGVEPASRVRGAGGRLALPRGAEVGYSLTSLAPHSALTLAGLSAPRGGDPRLEVILRLDGGPSRRLALLAPARKALRIALPELGRRPVRLSLRAVGGDLVLARPAVEGFIPPRPAAPAATSHAGARNVILYMIDTLRADHLGCYGYPLPISPHIDRFAALATRFANAVAQSPWTRPSTASLFTGLWPKTHAVNGRRDALAPEAITLAETLAARGWSTAGFVSNGNVARSLGFGQGFERYKLLPGRANGAPEVNAAALDWLDGRDTANRRDPAKPFFLFLHTVEPHSPYDPPEPFRQRFAPAIAPEVGTRRWLKQLMQRKMPVTSQLKADVQALYDAEIAANDAAFGDLVAALRERGLWDETVVVLVSDHGEEFHEHGGWEHGNRLHREVLEVPLIVRIPGLGTGRTVSRQAQHIDVMPTLLAWLGVPVPPAVEGRNLLPLIAGQAAPELGDDVACSWMEVDGFVGGAVSVPDWRLLELAAPVYSRELYDRSDLAEATDLSRERPVAAGWLTASLKACERPKRGRLPGREGTIDAEVREQLRALGYIE